MEEIFEFLSNNVLLVIIVLVFVFILASVTYANYAFDRYQNYYNELKKHKVNFDGNAKDFAIFLSNLKFNNVISVEVQDEKNMKSNGSYIPSESKIVLGSDVAYDNSLASFAVVAHEFGHSIQYYDNKNILKDHFKFHNFVKFLGLFSNLLIIFAIVMTIFSYWLIAIITVGILFLFFLIALCLKLSTINIEDDASQKAIQMLKELKIFKEEEINLMKRLLHYAKGTYIADFFRALLFWTALVRKTKIF